MGNVLGRTVRLTGNVLPLRGFASFLSDAGVPGGPWLKSVLTPSHLRRWNDHRLSSYKDDLLYLVGAALGDKECARKLACRSGKRVGGVPGSSLLTLLMSGLGGYVPEVAREPYIIMRDSLLYSDDCEQYDCTPR